MISFKIKKILLEYYETVEILSDFLLRFRNINRDIIFMPEDTSSYIKLLNKTIIATNLTLNPIPVNSDLSKEADQIFLIYLTINEILTKNNKSSNILSKGFTKSNENINNNCFDFPSLSMIENNEYITRFQFSPWLTLHTRIGDQIMKYILKYATIFEPLNEERCYVQLNNIPTNHLNVRTKQILKINKSRKLFDEINSSSKVQIISDDDSIENRMVLKQELIQNVKTNSLTYMLKKRNPRKRHKKKVILDIELLKDYQPYNRLEKLERNHILYARASERFSPKFINTFNNDKNIFVMTSFKCIFYKSLESINDNMVVINKYKDLSNFIKLLLFKFFQKHNTCKYIFLLNFNCKIKHFEDADIKIFPNCCNILQHQTDHENVYQFVKQCILKVVPIDLFGTKNNQKQFLRHVKKIINLGLYEEFVMGQLMHGIESKCLLLKSVSNNSDKLNILAKIFNWLVNHYVLKLIKSYFYMTESKITRNKILYFRASLWRKLEKQCFEKYLSENVYTEISYKEGKCVNNFKSSLRFLPKTNSLRPLINLSKVIEKSNNYLVSVNLKLKDMLQVLNFEKKNNKYFKNVCYCLNDTYKILTSYIKDWKINPYKLYFVKVDIKECYDSIDQTLLMNILDEFLIVNKTYKYKNICKLSIGRDTVKKVYLKEAAIASFINNNFNFMREYIIKHKARDIIFIDQGRVSSLNKQAIVSKFKQIFSKIVIDYNNKYYRQLKGIPQGAIVSSTLCNLYYGHMINQYFETLHDEILLRQIDDFLLITPSVNRALEFLDLMNRGIIQYNCYLNKNKTIINFECTDEKIYMLKKGELLTWCGICIDTETVEIHCDFSIYRDAKISDTISMNLAQNQGLMLKTKLVHALRGKINKIYIDPVINSDFVIIENLFKIFYLTAVKFDVSIRQLPDINSQINNSSFFMSIIVILFITAFRLIREFNFKNYICSYNSIKLLCLEAFYRYLQNYPAQYKKLLLYINKSKFWNIRCIHIESYNKIYDFLRIFDIESFYNIFIK